MGVLFAAAEYMDFTSVGGAVSIGPYVNSSFYNAANSRVTTIIGPGAEDTVYVEGSITSTADLWVHFTFGQVSALGTNRICKLYSGGTNRLGLRMASSGALELSKWNGTAWVVLATSTLTGLIAANVYYIIDLHVTVGNPARASVYFNGSPVISDATLDLSWAGVTGYDKVRFGSAHTSNFNSTVGEVIVADFNTLNSKVVSRTPDANGTYTAWTGTFAEIDDPSGGTDFISGAADGNRESWTHTNFPALGANESIAYVGMGASALRDAAGPQSFNMFTRVGTTDYDKANETVIVAYGNFAQSWLVNPATSAAWTVAELDAAEFGVRART